MSMISALRYSGWPLKRKLFVSMLLLAVLVLTALASALILSGRTHSTAAVYRDALAMQMEVFGKDISAHFDQLAASAITLWAMSAEEQTGFVLGIRFTKV